MELNAIDEIINKNDFSRNYINEIKKKVNIMNQSKYRTTNFSIIVYFVKNNFLPLNKSILISNLLRDYKASPKSFVISKINSVYKSESTFRRSIRYYIQKNNSFFEGPGKGQLSINLENACYYLRTVFNKYTNNSNDVTTPIKAYNNQKNRNRNGVLNIKNELINSDDSDEDNKISLFSPKENNINYNKYNYKKYLDKNEHEQYDYESQGNNSIISLTDSSYKKSVDKTKYENIKTIPRIFISKLINDSIISSLDKINIFRVMNSTSEYIANIEDFENNPKILDEFKKLYTSLQNLLENINSYEKVLNSLNIFQIQILDAWKLMKNQLNSVNLAIKTKNYRYDLYVKLRDIIYQTEGIYKDNLENIKYNLNQLNDIEKKTKEESKIIQRTLTLIKNDIDSGINFIELFKLIRDKLNIKEKFLENEDINQDDEYNFDLVDNVGIIVKKFHDEKKKIMEEIKLIDKNVGNIMIY